MATYKELSSEFKKQLLLFPDNFNSCKMIIMDSISPKIENLMDKTALINLIQDYCKRFKGIKVTTKYSGKTRTLYVSGFPYNIACENYITSKTNLTVIFI